MNPALNHWLVYIDFATRFATVVRDKASEAGINLTNAQMHRAMKQQCKRQQEAAGQYLIWLSETECVDIDSTEVVN